MGFDETGRRTDNYIEKDEESVGNRDIVRFLIIALIFAAFVGWFSFRNYSTDGDGITRSTPPLTSSPTTGMTSSDPTTVPKQQ